MIEIIEPCGFLINDKRFKRVAMDYFDEKMIKFIKTTMNFIILKKGKKEE